MSLDLILYLAKPNNNTATIISIQTNLKFDPSKRTKTIQSFKILCCDRNHKCSICPLWCPPRKWHAIDAYFWWICTGENNLKVQFSVIQYELMASNEGWAKLKHWNNSLMTQLCQTHTFFPPCKSISKYLYHNIHVQGLSTTKNTYSN